MYLTDMLRKLGDRLGIIEMAPASTQKQAPVKVQTRTVTLTELITAIRVTELRQLAEMPAELSVPFEQVFNAAGIPASPKGWTVEQLEAFLKSDEIRKMDREQAQHETLRALAEGGIDGSDIIRDAIARDQALDAFEDSIAKKRREWLGAKKLEIRQVEAEIASEEKAWAEWRSRKRQREKDMAAAVSYLIDKPVISIEEE
jgi:hypothetical protein